MAFWHSKEPKHTCSYRTVAIDTSNGWHSRDRITKEMIKSSNHIIKFMICDGCNDRIISADDPEEDGRNYAMNKHSEIALQRSIWENAGKITGFDPDNITWIDPVYAPLGGFDRYLSAMKKDKALVDIMTANPALKDALGEFEVLIKLHTNT